MRGIALVLLVACGKQAGEPAPSPGSAPARDAAGSDAAVAIAIDAAELDAAGGRARGEACGVGTACADGLRCITTGDQYGTHTSTCEIPCDPDMKVTCPVGTGCVHFGGGRSYGCRKH